MSAPRENIDPVEIESETENGDSTSTYVFDVGDYLLAGEACAGLALGLAEVCGRDSAETTPLSAVVDCDAVERLLGPRRYGDLRDEVSVTFPYDVYEVTVRSSGRVVVRG
jgi:hypothetical protein